MTAHILDGRAMGAEIKAELRDDVRRYIEVTGRAPGLVIVRIGGDAASGVYSRVILRVAEEVGIKASLEQLPTLTSADELRSQMVLLNNDESVQGIIFKMQLPSNLLHMMIADIVSTSKNI